MTKTTTRSAKRLASSRGSHGGSHHPPTNWSHNGNENHDGTVTFDQRTRTTTMRTTNNDVKYNFEVQTQWLIYTHIQIVHIPRLKISSCLPFKLGPSYISFLSSRVIFHFDNYGRSVLHDFPTRLDQKIKGPPPRLTIRCILHQVQSRFITRPRKN